MSSIGHPLHRNWTILLAGLWLSALPASAQMDTKQFATFARESELMNQDDPGVNLYRAGIYKGYLSGVLDTLRAGKTCTYRCTCELDKMIRQHVDENPELQDRPVMEWLPTLVSEKFPCR